MYTISIHFYTLPLVGVYVYTLRLVGGVHTTLPYTTPPGKKLAVYVCTVLDRTS